MLTQTKTDLISQDNIEDFFRQIKEHDPNIPVLIQSADPENEKYAKEYGNGFLNKNSKSLPAGIKSFYEKPFLLWRFCFH